ncbi:MAG: ABC transporter ATP-binding protein [Clostridia bacterium]|nr:ABC transporter ATP-binding protein [Clostridia bacterium]
MLTEEIKKTALIEVENLFKKYSTKGEYAIEDISISGLGGEIIGILGHNGAGKSTTIKCMTGIHPYQEGSIKICGYDIQKDNILAKSNFGYVTDEFTLFEKMTGFEYINFLADVYKVNQKDRTERIEEFQKVFALGDAIYQLISSYSHGMKQKISIMGALIHQPKVFVLDEPMVGLDPYTANQLKNFIKYYASKGNLVLFSSHNLDVVSKLCDRVYIIDQGRILEILDMHKFNESKKDFEEYFLSITKREARA